ncbi:MAG: UDP-N-acetylglucosamine 2-epimerase (non-hydrolyzing) [Actinobacteria bacterium]|nr:UDP-N-acetylglucosamine 2-epimerase (non-hydrolyzing) [Actinomycetota bacterium]
MKVFSVVGNRPQFVKSAPLSVALRAEGIEEVVLHTGQHYDPELSQVFFDELGLGEPRYRLGISALPRDEMLARMQPAIGAALAEERPDWTLVYGDTNSTLAGARAASAVGVALAHVEAGLRSGDLSMPEEHNRIEVDAISDLLLCPDERSSTTLAREEVRGDRQVVGDVMADACFRLAPLARRRSRILDALTLQPGRYVIATVHREANVRASRLARIMDGLNRLAEPVVFPAHPRTRAALETGGLTAAPHVQVVRPLGYLDFAALASQARVIATDSGGLQKEAYWYGVPCVTMRPSTEWVDTVEAGANQLVDADPDRIVDAVTRARMPLDRPALYGDGHAAERIAAALYASPR